MKNSLTVMWAALASGSALLGSTAAQSGIAQKRTIHVASNAYSWQVYLAREGRDFQGDLASGLRMVRESGSDGLEPLLTSVEDAKRMGEALRSQGLEMRSAYVNTTLHTEQAVGQSIRDVLAIAQEARKHGTRIIVTNPVPVQWGGSEDKSDAQLRVQADALNTLGRELRGLGMTLAYHNHDSELRQAARELHHMMVGTDPRAVKLCLDAHWIYRGAGNSQVALQDFVTLYGKRIIEVHVRQSSGGTWSETFGVGDIDYERLVALLRGLRLRPHIVVEQAVEAGTPHTMDALAAMRLSIERVRTLFTVTSDGQ